MKRLIGLSMFLILGVFIGCAQDEFANQPPEKVFLAFEDALAHRQYGEAKKMLIKEQRSKDLTDNDFRINVVPFDPTVTKVDIQGETALLEIQGRMYHIGLPNSDGTQTYQLTHRVNADTDEDARKKPGANVHELTHQGVARLQKEGNSWKIKLGDIAWGRIQMDSSGWHVEKGILSQ